MKYYIKENQRKGVRGNSMENIKSLIAKDKE